MPRLFAACQKVFTIFADAFPQDNELSAKKSTFLVKGVIEIIFISEILAKFQSTEDNEQQHRINGLYSPQWLSTYLLVWAIALSGTKAMREASRI